MSLTVEDSAVYRATRRQRRKEKLTQQERIALNVFWREGVPVPLLAKVFRIAKNTIYYKALTGQAESYPTASQYEDSGAQINDWVEEMGVEKARELYVTKKMRTAIKRHEKAQR